MSDSKYPDYTCPRCNYKTLKKNHMEKHLFSRKKQCPGHCIDITLTDEIKQHILNNRIYHIPKPVDPVKVFKQTITYNNTMNNIVSSMDTVEKLQKLMSYQNIRSIGFNKHIENTLQYNVDELKDKSNDVLLSNNDILDLVDKVSLISSSKEDKPMEAFNILYDTKMRTLKTCNSNGSWNEHLLHKGIQMVIQAIKETYLDEYEVALIQKMNKLMHRSRAQQELHTILESYYKFLACFELSPVVVTKTDRDLLYERWTPQWTACKSQSREKAESYLSIYSNIQDNLLQKDIINLHKKAVEILCHNTKRNIDDLNKMVVGLFTKDDNFKATLANKPQERGIEFYRELYEGLDEDSDSDSDDELSTSDLTFA